MRETKLFLNGSRYWLRLPDPSKARLRVPTGTADEKLAKRIRDMVDDMATNPLHRHWVTRVEEGQVSLSDLYDHRSQGTLEALRVSLDQSLVVDENLWPHVDAWYADKAKSKPAIALEYKRQLEVLFPRATLVTAGTHFSLSLFKRKEVFTRLSALDVDAPTKNRYKAAVSSFAKYLVMYDVLESNFVRDIPGFGENDPRVVYYDRTQSKAVIAGYAVDQWLAAAAAAIACGFAAEWAAIESMRPGDIDLTPGHERIHIRGTKRSTRDRWVPLVRENAWVLEYIRPLIDAQPERYFPFSKTQMLRWQQAVATKLEIVAEGEELYGQHTFHDWRHTHAVQLLRDGYSEQIAAWHLGHKNTDMVRRIYAVFIPTREDYARAKPSTETQEKE